MKEPTTYTRPNAGNVNIPSADKAAENPTGLPVLVGADSESADEKAARTTDDPQPVAGESDESKR